MNDLPDRTIQMAQRGSKTAVMREVAPGVMLKTEPPSMVVVASNLPAPETSTRWIIGVSESAGFVADADLKICGRLILLDSLIAKGHWHKYTGSETASEILARISKVEPEAYQRCDGCPIGAFCTYWKRCVQQDEGEIAGVGWAEIAHFRPSQYKVVEQGDGWHVYSYDERQADWDREHHSGG